MKILAFGGSNAKDSINKTLAEYTAKQFTGAEVEVLLFTPMIVDVVVILWLILSRW